MDNEATENRTAELEGESVSVWLCARVCMCVRVCVFVCTHFCAFMKKKFAFICARNFVIVLLSLQFLCVCVCLWVCTYRAWELQWILGSCRCAIPTER